MSDLAPAGLGGSFGQSGNSSNSRTLDPDKLTLDGIIYESFAGTDITAVIILPGEQGPLVLGELQTISYSIHRENTPIRTLGHTNVMGFVKGPRTIAGSMIFYQFNQYAFYRLQQYRDAMRNQLFPLADMLPPFDIVLSFSNEYGAFSRMRIYGTTIVDEGTTMSIDDLMTEQTYCVDEETEILTTDGWKKYKDVNVEDDFVLTLNPLTKAIEWQFVESLHQFPYKGEMIQWNHYRGLNALTTPNHRWLTTTQYQTDQNGFANAKTEFKTTEELENSGRKIYVGGGIPLACAITSSFSNELVELIGFAVTEGHYRKQDNVGVVIAQSESANPYNVDRLRYLVKHFKSQNATASEYLSGRKPPYDQCHDYYFGRGIGEIIRKLAPGKSLSPEFLTLLTLEQAQLLYDTMMSSDGYSDDTQSVFIQNPTKLVDDFQMLCSMLGKRTSISKHGKRCVQVNIYQNNFTVVRNWKNRPTIIDYDGIVWCPKTPNGTWLARRNGSVYWTGNTFMARGIQPLTSYIPSGFERLQSTDGTPPLIRPSISFGAGA